MSCSKPKHRKASDDVASAAMKLQAERSALAGLFSAGHLSSGPDPHGFTHGVPFPAPILVALFRESRLTVTKLARHSHSTAQLTPLTPRSELGSLHSLSLQHALHSPAFSHSLPCWDLHSCTHDRVTTPTSPELEPRTGQHSGTTTCIARGFSSQYSVFPSRSPWRSPAVEPRVISVDHHAMRLRGVACQHGACFLLWQCLLSNDMRRTSNVEVCHYSLISHRNIARGRRHCN